MKEVSMPLAIKFRGTHYGPFKSNTDVLDALMSAGFERDSSGWFSQASGDKHYAQIVSDSSHLSDDQMLDGEELVGLNRIMAY